jgi:hypothetical protein
MLIGRVVGDIVATQKAPSHFGRKLLVVQPLNLDGSDRGEVMVALDAVDGELGVAGLLFHVVDIAVERVFQRLVDVHGQHQMRAALQVETEVHALARQIVLPELGQIGDQRWH